jgi:hypothetical protein
MANEMYRCPLCPDDAPEFELAESRALSVYEWPTIGPTQMVIAQLADGTKHEHNATIGG